MPVFLITFKFKILLFNRELRDACKKYLQQCNGACTFDIDTDLCQARLKSGKETTVWSKAVRSMQIKQQRDKGDG